MLLILIAFFIFGCIDAKTELLNERLRLCDSTDCSSSGSCFGLKSKPICLCYAGFIGSRCEKKVFSEESSNNGLCFGDQTNFTCLCKIGYSGKTCELSKNLMVKTKKVGKRSPLSWILPCGPADCSFRGLCIGTVKMSLCLCMFGFSGKMCEHNIFDAIAPQNGGLANLFLFCSAADCNKKGICLGTKAVYSCLCFIGYHGKNCEKSIFSLCEPDDCNNNGLCFGSKHLFTCACYQGYKGKRCEIASGIPCESSDCSGNGVCLGMKGQETCICNLGFSGRRCEIKTIQNNALMAPSTELCEVSDCFFNGLCFGPKISPNCVCNPGYKGTRCEIEPPCNSKFQCNGHGNCMGTHKNYICSCDSRWTGENCQTPSN